MTRHLVVGCSFFGIALLLIAVTLTPTSSLIETQEARLIEGGEKPLCDSYLYTMSCTTWTAVMYNDCLPLQHLTAPYDWYCATDECDGYECFNPGIPGIYQWCAHYLTDLSEVIDLLNCTYDTHNCGTKMDMFGPCELQVPAGGGRPTCDCVFQIATLEVCGGAQTLDESDDCNPRALAFGLPINSEHIKGTFLANVSH